MAKFQYATKDNKLKTFEAANSLEAANLVRGFTDAAPRTGVMVVVDQPAAAVTKGGKVDVSQVPNADVKPFEEPKRGNTATVVKTIDNPDGTTTNILSNGQRSTGRYKQGAGGSLDFVEQGTAGYEFADISWEDLAPEEQLSRQAGTIRKDIEELETRMAGRASERNEMLDDAEVFDDMRELNRLKDELRKAEDREVEIPIEARQKLRGRQATKTEFGQMTRPALENNLLEQLAGSRAVSRLTDTINTNIKIVDSYIEAETARDEFLYEQKTKRLDKIEEVYGNIITEKQKIALEDRKFQQSLILEDVKLTNQLRGDLIKDIAGMGIGGAQLSGLMTASVDELLSFKSSVSAPSNWINMTPEQAAMTLSEDQYSRYTAYQEQRKKLTDEQNEMLTAGIAQQQSSKEIVDTLTTLLNDKEGLSNSVGFGLGNMDISLWGIGNETATWRANAKKLLSATTLQTLQNLKATGATLGSVTEKELQILATANQALQPILDKNGNVTGRFEMKEEDFKTALQTMRLASMRTYIAASIGKEAFARANYLNADYDTVEKRYQDLVANGVKPTVPGAAGGNFYETDHLQSAFNVVSQEEGLRTEAYQDQTGTWTIGYGTTMIGGRPVRPGDRISVGQAAALAQTQIVENYTNFADRVSTPVSPNQFAALTSFEYNLGPGVWDQPTGQQILALVDQGRPAEAGRLMLQYNKSRNPQTGALEVNPVLTKRRQREASLLLA